LPSALANCERKVFVDAAEQVLGAAGFVPHLDVADHVDQLAQALLVERGAGVVLGQHALQRRVVALDAGHRVVDQLADGALARLRLENRPARLGRHPEDALRAVLVGILGVGAFGFFGQQRGVLLLEGIGDVLQEQQAQADMLVLGGVHAAAQRIGHLPEPSFVANGGAAIAVAGFLGRGSCHYTSSCTALAHSFGCATSMKRRIRAPSTKARPARPGSATRPCDRSAAGSRRVP
jgi:hypothetical protein